MTFQGSDQLDPALVPPPLADGSRRAEDAELVAAVLLKDRKAAAEFVSRFADPVFAYVSQRLAPRRDLVEDVVQEVFLIGLQKLGTFAGHASLLAWLLGIARHKVEDLYRARLREPRYVSDLDELTDAGVTVMPELDEQLDRARAEDKTRQVLEQMPEEYGIVLLWRYWEKRSTREMAEQIGKTEKAVERLLARARASFRELWERHS